MYRLLIYVYRNFTSIMKVKGKVMFLFLLVFFINAKAQKFNSDRIYDAYVQNKMDAWKNICDGMQQNLTNSNEFILNLINFQYGYIANCMDNKKHTDALKYLDLAEKNLQLVEKNKYKPSVVKSYKSAFCAFRAGLDSKEGMKYGIKSLDFAERAISEDSTNYFAYLQRANIYRHTPEIFNGSKSKAIEYYLKAESLIKKDITGNINNWNYLNLLVAITETYIEVKNFIGANKYCDKILKIEPDFYLVKDVIYPKIKKHTK